MKKVNPLLVFTGLALVTLAALAGVTYDRWSSQDSWPEALLAEAQSNAPDKIVAADTKQQNSGSSKTADALPKDVATSSEVSPGDQQVVETKADKPATKSDAGQQVVKTAKDTASNGMVGNTTSNTAQNEDVAKINKTAAETLSKESKSEAENSPEASQPAVETGKTTTPTDSPTDVVRGEQQPQSGAADKQQGVEATGNQASVSAGSEPKAAQQTADRGQAAADSAPSQVIQKTSPKETESSKLDAPPATAEQQPLPDQDKQQDGQGIGQQASIAADKGTTVEQKAETEGKAGAGSVPGQEVQKTSPADAEPAGTDGGSDMKVAEAPATGQDVPEEPAKSGPAATGNSEQNIPKTNPSASAFDSKPTFDTVRVETTGDAVAAGEAAPNSEVTLLLDGKPIGKTTANADGNWVIIPDQPLAPGAGALSVEQKLGRDGKTVESEQTIAVLVPPKPDKKPMVALVEPDQPVRIIQTPQEEKPAAIQGKVALDSIDYNDDGDILFSGRADAGSAVRLYIDNHMKGDAVADASGRWSFTGREDVAAGTHALRVDRIDTGGKVVSRIELPFVREEATKAAAIVSAPEVAVGKTEPNAPPKQESPPQEPKVAANEMPPASDSARASQTVAKSDSETVPPPAKSDLPAAAVQQESASDGAGNTSVTPPPPPKAEQELSANTPDATTPTGGAVAIPKNSSETEVAAATPAVTPETPRQGHIVIQPGNNLWKLSRVIYGRGTQFTVIYEANKEQIRNPGRIYPGQIFTTPNATPPDKIDPKRKTPLTPDEGGTTLP